MTKSTNLAIRIVGVAGAIAAGVFTYLYKGKVELVMAKTSDLVAEGAGNTFESRVNKIPEVYATLQERRAKVTEHEGTIKDLLADVAEKKTRIEELNANVSNLENERADLTRKRDELTASLSAVTSERDSLTSQLNSAREEVARKTEIIGTMFTREQLDAEIAAKNKAEDSRNDVVTKYVRLYNWIQNASGATPPPEHPRDPSYVGGPGVKVELEPELVVTRVVNISPSQGLISFSVGSDRFPSLSARENPRFKIRLGERADVGSVIITEVGASFCIAQILPGTDLDALSRGQVLTLEPVTGKVAAK